MSNQLYNFLNSLVKIILPALGTFYFTMSGLWGFPAADKVVGTITALCLLLGFVINAARKGWVVDDTILVDDSDPENVNFGFEKNLQLENLNDGQYLALKVHKIQ